MTIKPLSDRVLIQPNPAEEKTAAGLIIPDTAKEKPLAGKVVAVGPGTSEVNQVNRIKLMLSTANKNLAKQNAPEQKDQAEG